MRKPDKTAKWLRAGSLLLSIVGAVAIGGFDSSLGLWTITLAVMFFAIERVRR